MHARYAVRQSVFVSLASDVLSVTTGVVDEFAGNVATVLFVVPPVAVAGFVVMVGCKFATILGERAPAIDIRVTPTRTESASRVAPNANDGTAHNNVKNETNFM